MTKPLFITFTGVDAKTNVSQCAALAQRYPVEFGFLLSLTSDDNRYSGMHKIEQFAEHSLQISVHLCGKAAREAMRTCTLPPQTRFAHRVQVNLRDQQYTSEGLAKLGAQRPTIQQTRDTGNWPSTPDGVFPLLDCSGGRGIEIREYPSNTINKLVGYAGGLNPNNVRSFVELLGDHPQDYWIDMETGVRKDDWFDLNLCEQVCKQVYDR